MSCSIPQSGPVRHSTVCRWENDVRHPALRFLHQILAITAIPAEIALGITNAQEATAGKAGSAHGA